MKLVRGPVTYPELPGRVVSPALNAARESPGTGVARSRGNCDSSEPQIIYPDG